MNTLFKSLFSGSLTAMIICTMVLLPYPANFGNLYASSNSVETNSINTQGCQSGGNTNSDGTPGVYVPGCDFNDALTKIKEDPGGGLKGIVEQFVMLAIAAAAVSTLKFTYLPRSLADCKANFNAKITLRLMQAGALALLLGEMKAKAAFKKASKDAADAAFVPTAKLNENDSNEEIANSNRVHNQKQLASFDAMLKVYDGKLKGIKTKQSLAIAAEMAFLGALGVELGMVLNEKGICAKTYYKYIKDQKVVAKQILAAREMAVAEAATARAYENEPLAAACDAAAAALVKLHAAELKFAAKKKAEAAAHTAMVIADNTKDQAENIGMLANLKSFFGMTDFAASSVVSAESALEARSIAIDTKSNANAVKGEASGAQQKATETATWEGSAATVKSCPGAYSVLSSAKIYNFQSENFPIQCCGADSTKLTNGYFSVPVPKGDMDIKDDIKFLDLFSSLKMPKLPNAPIPTSIPEMEGGDSPQPPKKSSFLSEPNDKDQLQLLKAGVINMLYSHYGKKYFHIVENDKINPKVSLQKIKSFHTYMEYLENNFEAEILNHPDVKKWEKRSQDSSPENLLAMIEEVKLSLVSDAKAMDFMTILGFGVKLFVLTKLTKKYFRRWLAKPKSRMWTFGAIAAVNGVLIMFNGKKLKENEKYRNIIKAERDRFAAANGLVSPVDSSGGSGDNSAVNLATGMDGFIDTKGQPACAVPKGSGFAASSCPSANRSLLQGGVKAQALEAKGVSPAISAIPSLVNDAVTAAANGQEGTDPNKMRAKLSNLNEKRGALRAAVDKLVKKYDAQTSSSGPKSNAKKYKRSSLGLALAKVRRGSGNNSLSSGSMAGLLDSNGSIKEASEKEEKDKTATGERVSAIPSFTAPGDNQFDFGDSSFDGNSESAIDEEGGVVEQEFELGENDISDNEDASIFKMISNRYLRSYPILLEEKTEQSSAQE